MPIRSLSEVAAGKMRVGACGGWWQYFATYCRCLNLVDQLAIVPIRYLQTTLAEAHVAGSGVFVLSDPEFAIGRHTWQSASSGPINCRLRDPVTKAVVPVTIWKISSSENAYVVGGPGFAGDTDWPAGALIETTGFANESSNAADWPVEELIVNGKGTGYPTCVRPGQRFPTGLGNAYLKLAPGPWDVFGKGTGVIHVALYYRDGTDDGQGQTITITDGVADKDLVLATAEVSDVVFNLIGSDPNNPLHELRIIPPGSWPVDGTKYSGMSFRAIYDTFEPKYVPHPDYIALRRKMRHHRNVDDGYTIISQSDTYAGIVGVDDLPPDTTQLGRGLAMAFEWQIEECILADCDLYASVGCYARDEVIDLWLDLWKLLAPPHLKLIITHDCESWNFDFSVNYNLSVRGSAAFNPRVCQGVSLITSGPNAGQVLVQKNQHGFTTGQTVVIASVGDKAYRGAYTITVVNANSFRYTPATTPTQAVCPESWSGPPIAYAANAPKVIAPTSVVWKADESGSYLEVTTAAPHGFDRNTVIHLSGGAADGLDGAYKAFWAAPMPTNVFRVDFLYQKVHGPDLPSAPFPATFAAASGQTLRACVIGETTGTPGVSVTVGRAVAMMHGRRNFQIHRKAEAAFPKELSRLIYMVEGMAASAEYNRIVCAQYLAEAGGKLLPVAPTVLTVATYLDPTGFDQRALYVGDMRPLKSVVVSGGVATLTCDDYPPDPVGNSSLYTDGFGWSTGDYITLFNTGTAENPRGIGRLGPITITGSGNTLTVPMPGVADGQLPTVRYGPYAVRGTPKGSEITGFTRSGEALTLQSPDHPWAVGQEIGIGGWKTPFYIGKFTVSSRTKDSFTVQVPGATYDPIFDFTHRAWAFDWSTTTHAAIGRLARTSDPEWLGWIDDVAAVAAEYGMLAGTYETGYQDFVLGYVERVAWVLPILVANSSDPATADFTRAAFEAHVVRKLWFYTYYVLVGWGEFGLRKTLTDATPISEEMDALIAEYGAPRPPHDPATGFLVQGPLTVRIGEDNGWVTVGPNGYLDSARTVTLSDGEGGTFDPPTLSFESGTASAQATRYTPAGFGSHTIYATVTPSLGETAMGGGLTLDQYGNAGNATLEFHDEFERADGPAGSDWESTFNGATSNDAKLIDGKLTMEIRYPRVFIWPVIDPLRDLQVACDLMPQPDGTTPSSWQVFLRADRSTGEGYYAQVENYSYTSRVGLNYRNASGGETGVKYINYADGAGSFDVAEPHELVQKIIDADPPRWIGSLTNKTTGATLAAWDFEVPSVDAFNNPIPELNGPGVVALGGNVDAPVQDNATVYFDNFKVWSLAYATGFRITPTTASGVAGVESDSFEIEPIGGPVLRDTIFALDDNGQSGTFSPPNPSLNYGDFTNPATFTYTPSGATGNRTLRATPNPTLGSPATATYTVSTGGSNDPTVGYATGFAIRVPNATFVNQPTIVVATLTGPTYAVRLGSDLVITLQSSGVDFGGTITIPAGQWFGSTTLTPTTAGAKTIGAQYNGGNGNMTVTSATTTATVAVSATPTVPTFDQIKAACQAAITDTPATLVSAYDPAKSAASASDVATAANNAVGNLSEAIVIPATLNGGPNGTPTPAVRLKTYIRNALASIRGNLSRTDPAGPGTVKDPVSGQDLFTATPGPNGSRTVTGSSLGG